MEKEIFISKLLEVYSVSSKIFISLNRAEMEEAMAAMNIHTPEEKKAKIESILTKALSEEEFSDEEKALLEHRHSKTRLFRKDIVIDFKEALIDFVYNAYDFYIESSSSGSVLLVDKITNRLSGSLVEEVSDDEDSVD